MPTANWRKLQTLIDDLLARMDDTISNVLTRVRGALPSYAGIPTGEIQGPLRRNIQLALTALREHRCPTPDEVDTAAGTADIRARQGVSVEDVLQGYRLVARETWALLATRARSAGVEAAALLEAAELVWGWTDAVTMQVALVHRRAELEMARHDQYERSRFLTALLFGSLGEATVHTRAAVYGLRAGQAYCPFRARGVDGTPPPEVERRLRSVAGGTLVLFANVEEDLAGLFETRIRIETPGVVVGIGPSAALVNMARSFQLASRALETAVRFGMRGSFAIEDIPLHAVIAAEEHIGHVFLERYLRPLETGGRLGRLLIETLTEFFRQGHDVERTAAVLSVHANTVRYRLRRFEEMTGAILSHTPDLIGTWWALERRTLRAEAPETANDRTIGDDP